MQINVVATDTGVLLSPWPADIEEYLKVTRRLRVTQPTVTKKGSIKVIQTYTIRKEDVWYCSNGSGVIPPAMAEYVVELLKMCGHTPLFRDLRTPCSTPDWSRLNKELRQGQREILEIMCTFRHALIQAATGLGKTEAMVQFRLINPDLRIGIVTFRSAVRDSIAHRLRQNDPDHTVCVIKANSIIYEAHTYVLVDKSLHKLDPSMIDVLIIDEVHGSGSERAFDQLLRFVGLRVYGLSATPFGRHDRADLVPIVLCGPLRLNLDYGFSVKTGANVPLHVYIYKAYGPDVTTLSDHMQEKLGFWRNTQRNALIAYICKNLPADDQTIVMCRSVEHVLRLRKMLPDFICVFNPVNIEREQELLNMGLLPPGWKNRSDFKLDPSEARKEFEENKLKKVICTPVWKEGVDFPNLRWVIRADGTVNKIFCIQAAGRLARKINGKQSAAVIDFMDMFGNMVQRSKARIKHYMKEGWHVHYMFDTNRTDKNANASDDSADVDMVGVGSDKQRV